MPDIEIPGILSVNCSTIETKRIHEDINKKRIEDTFCTNTNSILIQQSMIKINTK